MNKYYLTVVLTLTCLLGPGTKAHAQSAKVSATIPFEFVAGGQLLPPGKYTVSPLAVDPHSGITIRGYNNEAIMLPVVVDDTSTEQSKLSFERVGNEHFLREVETPGGTYTFVLPRALVALAQANEQDTVSSSGAH